jgi:hypothetical protein
LKGGEGTDMPKFRLPTTRVGCINKLLREFELDAMDKENFELAWRDDLKEIIQLHHIETVEECLINIASSLSELTELFRQEFLDQRKMNAPFGNPVRARQKKRRRQFSGPPAGVAQ